MTTTIPASTSAAQLARLEALAFFEKTGQTNKYGMKSSRTCHASAQKPNTAPTPIHRSAEGDSWARCATNNNNRTSGTTRFAVASIPLKNIDVESTATSALAISATRRPPPHRCDQHTAERTEQRVCNHRGLDCGSEDRVGQTEEVRVEGCEEKDALPHPVAARDLDRPLVIQARVSGRELEKRIVERDFPEMQEAQREGEREDQPRSNLLSA